MNGLSEISAMLTSEGVTRRRKVKLIQAKALATVIDDFEW
jgi:hypothetical protein